MSRLTALIAASLANVMMNKLMWRVPPVIDAAFDAKQFITTRASLLNKSHTSACAAGISLRASFRLIDQRRALHEGVGQKFNERTWRSECG
jgi:hypothetical protein